MSREDDINLSDDLVALGGVSYSSFEEDSVVFSDEEEDAILQDVQDENISDEEGNFEDAEENPQDGEVPLNRELPRDTPLYNGSGVTMMASLVAILTFSIVHNLTGVALADLLKFIALHCPDGSRCLKTVYRFIKYFEGMESPLKYHFLFTMFCFITN